MQNKFWQIVVERGRLCQWLVIVGCIIVSLCGGFNKFLQAEHITKIMLYAVVVAGGIECIKQLLTRGETSGSD